MDGEDEEVEFIRKMKNRLWRGTGREVGVAVGTIRNQTNKKL